MKRVLVIAIDGPSASGKGTLAKKISKHFNIPYLNTGALYRLVAFRMINQKIDLTDFENKIPQLTANFNEKELENEKIFTEEVGFVASKIAKIKNLRLALFKSQKEFIENGKNNFGGAVLDGRDTTTIICSDADYKFFITADVEIRAKRRFDQLLKNKEKVTFDEILEQLKKRDENDFNRIDSPLKIAKDAIVIDNGNLSIEESFQTLLKNIKI
jgi:cytidylate kinase